MSTCRACGAALSESARFCPVCGQAVGPRCAGCGASVDGSARFCPSCGAPVGGEHRFAEERKLVTLLFADVTGSTSMGEHLDAERMRALLREYFAAMSAVVSSWGGRVEKFIGDAVMAVFGVPAAREDDPSRALHAALEMLERLDLLNVKFRERHGTAVQIRIGVNTGEVIAPVDPAQELVLSGDAVNVAARLEQAAEPGTILVGERTFLAARGAFVFDEPRSLSLKGKADAVPARRVLGVAAEPARSLPGIRAPLVGRDGELRILTELLNEAVETRRPRMALLSGPAGIGKSRLMQELLEAASEGAHRARVLRGRCLAVGHGITYWALGEIIRSFAGIGLDEPAETAQRKLRDAVAALVDGGGSEGDADGDRMIQALALTAGIPLPGNPLETLDPEAVASELGRTWPRFATALAREWPTVLVIEDMHWAREQSIEMLERLLTRSQGPLFILITARPEFAEAHPRLGAASDDASVISLRPLTESQSAELVSGLLDAAALPDELRDEILQKAEGNPFFVEEMVRRLIDEEVLVREPDGWRATDAARGVSLPDSVHALLAARIDALPVQEKRVLQEASVIGRIFWQTPVERAVGNGAVGAALLRLEQRGLVLARPNSTIAGEPEYIFKHALVRDVAYASLPKARRGRAHAEAGAWMSELAGDRVDEFAELLAHHYQTAVAGEDADLAWEADEEGRTIARARAYEALIQAGAGARRRFEVDKATELHHAALELAATAADRAMALEQLGDDYFAVYHNDEAIAALREALELARSSGDRRAGVRLAFKIGRTALRWGAFRTNPEPEWVEGVIGDALSEAETDEDRVGLQAVRAAAHVGWYGAGKEDPVPLDQRIAWGEEALQEAYRLGDPLLIARAAGSISLLYARRGSFRQAAETYGRLLEIVDRQPSRDVQGMTYAGVADDTLMSFGDPDRALELARRGYELATGTSDHELMHTTAPLLRALFWAGRWAEIPNVIDAHLAAYRQEAHVSCPEVQYGPLFAARYFIETGDLKRSGRAAALIRRDIAARRVARTASGPTTPVGVALAEYDLAAGRVDEALAVTGSFMEKAGPAELREVAATRLAALCAAERWDDVAELIARIEPLSDETPVLEPIIAHTRGRAAAAAGDSAKAIAALRQAIAGFERVGHPFLRARAQEALAQFVEDDEALALYQDALAAYEQLGAVPHAERVHSLLCAG